MKAKSRPNPVGYVILRVRVFSARPSRRWEILIDPFLFSLSVGQWFNDKAMCQIGTGHHLSIDIAGICFSRANEVG